MDIVDLTNRLLLSDGLPGMGLPELVQYASNDCEVIHGRRSDNIDIPDPTTELRVVSARGWRPRSGGEWYA
jgi:hypothetical protein